jgi:hypothetical protein
MSGFEREARNSGGRPVCLITGGATKSLSSRRSREYSCHLRLFSTATRPDFFVSSLTLRTPRLKRDTVG